MLVAFGEEGYRPIEGPAPLCDLTQDGQAATDAAMIPAPLRTGEGLACNSLRPLGLSSSQQVLSECVQNCCARSD
jgi:hypothetical protein